jgi:transcriptional regulator with GAF, ATPase, and Fis domain
MAIPSDITRPIPKTGESVVSNHHVLHFSTSASPVPLFQSEHHCVGGIDGIMGGTTALKEVLDRARRVAPTDMPVLITGETGTGKEVLARAIHLLSRRASQHLVSVNIAALPDTLAAAELFGHERGAFTGADRLRVGRFEMADRATLFLDEIGELTPDVQVLLLRALQDGEFERLGSGTTRRADVRLIAATNRDLALAMQEGRFREDLFYRLSVFPIQLPPLRDRAEDIPTLAEYFLKRAAVRLRRRFSGIEAASLRRLQEYEWPGNIRQLQNVIEQSAILCDEGLLHVAASALAPVCTGARLSSLMAVPEGATPTLEEIKKRYISQLLASTRGNMQRAAEILDINPRTLYRMVARYKLRSV